MVSGKINITLLFGSRAGFCSPQNYVIQLVRGSPFKMTKAPRTRNATSFFITFTDIEMRDDVTVRSNLVLCVRPRGFLFVCTITDMKVSPLDRCTCTCVSVRCLELCKRTRKTLQLPMKIYMIARVKRNNEISIQQQKALPVSGNIFTFGN